LYPHHRDLPVHLSPHKRSRKLEVTATLLLPNTRGTTTRHKHEVSTVSTKYSVREIAQHQASSLTVARNPAIQPSSFPIMPRYGRIIAKTTDALAARPGHAETPTAKLRSSQCTRPPRALWPFQTRIQRSASSLETIELSALRPER
jgi:hypothetical protein